MKNFRLDENNISELLAFVDGIYPLTEEIARKICVGTDPACPCTQVYGAFDNKGEHSVLASIMTATYSVVFPHKDGSRIVHLSGAYTKDDFRHQGYASILLNAIEKDARYYFYADYICCDSTANELYLKNGFKVAPAEETRLWKQLT